MDIYWPRVRQVILNDRINGYKPDRACLNKIAGLLPDAKYLGFGKYYEYHWYLIIESKSFPDTITPIGIRGAVPLTSIINSLANKTPLYSI